MAVSKEERTEEEVLHAKSKDIDDSVNHDPRDVIILQNQKEMQMMQRSFKKSAENLRLQLHDYVNQSTRIQNEMLDRILQLKYQFQEIKDRNEFCKRKLPSQVPKKAQKKRRRQKCSTYNASAV